METITVKFTDLPKELQDVVKKQYQPKEKPVEVDTFWYAGFISEMLKRMGYDNGTVYSVVNSNKILVDYEND